MEKDIKKYSRINIRLESILGLTIKDFINDCTPHTQVEFFERYIPLLIMTMNKEKFMELYIKNLEEQNKEIDDRLKTILRLTEIMKFYNLQENAFETNDGELVSADNLLSTGYTIIDNKLYINKK